MTTAKKDIDLNFCFEFSFFFNDRENLFVLLQMHTNEFKEKKSQSQNWIQHFAVSRTFFNTGSRAIAAQRAEWQTYQC